MKLLRMFLAGAAFLAAALVQAAGFEGVVDYKMVNKDGEKQGFQYETKGGKVRVNMNTPQGERASSLMDVSSRTMTILMHDKKKAMKMTLPKAASTAKNGAKGKFTKTGKTEKIAGVQCAQYVFEDEFSEGELWSAQGMGKFMSFNQQPGEASAWERELAGKDMFPLRIISQRKGKEDKTTIEATKVERKAIPDSRFQVPSDYSVMEGMGGGSKGKSTKGASADQQEMMEKMMNASPEERQKMMEELRKQYGGKE